MTAEQAKIVLFEQALEQAIHTIEFLDGCLCHPNECKYAYPEHTQTNLSEFKKLVVMKPLCAHSMDVPDCKSCQARNERWQQREEAIKTLNLYGH